MKWIFLYCSVFFLIGCGDETRQSEDSHDKNAAIKDLPSVDVEKINKDLAGLGHKTVSKFKDDTLTIDLYVLDEDYSSKYYIDILIEVLILTSPLIFIQIIK
jgi:hypothetical protein